MARPRGNYAATAERRDGIIRAALEVFGEFGFNGSSLKQVAEVVGISEAGILHHFGSKGNLLAEVLRSRDSQSELFVPVGGNCGIEFVTGWLNLVEYNSKHPGHVELFTILAAEAISPKHPAHAYFAERYDIVFGMAKGYFQKMQTAGQLVDGLIPEDIAVTLIALSDGLQLQWLITENVDLVEQNAGFFRAILRAEAWAEVEQMREKTGPVLAQKIADIETSLPEPVAV